jgi:hypothetical protein
VDPAKATTHPERRAGATQVSAPYPERRAGVTQASAPPPPLDRVPRDPDPARRCGSEWEQSFDSVIVLPIHDLGFDLVVCAPPSVWPSSPLCKHNLAMGGMVCFSMVVIDDNYEGWSVPAIRHDIKWICFLISLFGRQ